jgi:hypothetical protein
VQQDASPIYETLRWWGVEPVMWPAQDAVGDRSAYLFAAAARIEQLLKCPGVHAGSVAS